MLDKGPKISPYAGIERNEWVLKTEALVKEHPLNREEIVEVTLKAWKAIFKSQFGSNRFRIGQHIFPRPQIMAFLLHELIPLELNAKYPSIWRRDESNKEKDLVYIPNADFSIEIKASSSNTGIYGNRSYAQPSTNAKKSKSGYLLAINFEKFIPGGEQPDIRMIRFGWLDHEDWLGQAAATGQQAHLERDAKKMKLLLLYTSKSAN